MSAFRPTVYSAKELRALSPRKRAQLRKEVDKHLRRHAQIRRILRQKTSALYKKLKKA
jgi:hypothetical protein